MVSVDYAYYVETYRGSAIPQSSFDEMAERSKEYVESKVFQPILPEHEDVLRRSVCKVAEVIYLERDGGGGVASETVGPHTITFKSQADRLSFEARLDYSIKVYLTKTGLLYRGL